MASLPADIYPSIFANLEPSSLFVLCQTCRFFLDKAQRILFHRVDLEGCSLRSTKSWCLAVTRHSHLAERVHALSLQLPESTGLSPADGTKIYGALMRCVNLKQLKVVFEKTSTNSGPISIHGWLINDCPFRLTPFINSYFHFGWIEEFWEARSEIRVLSAPDSSALALKTLGDWLPNLIAVKTAYVRALPDGRPLQRIEAGFAHRRDYSPLAQYSRTLTTLNLVRQWFDRDASFFDAITAIAELLPALVNLGITEVDRQILVGSMTLATKRT